MQTWKKLLIKIPAFLIIFAILFLGIQDVLRWKGENAEYNGKRFQAFQEENSVDVLYLGSSPVYAGITPIIIWKESGITGINLGTSNQTAFCNYYLLQYALQFHTPKVLVLDFADLCEDRSNLDEYESTYKKALDVIKSPGLRLQFIREIVALNEEEDLAYLLFPLLRYHERWKELTKNDFTDEALVYQSYQKGALFKQKTKSIQPSDSYEPGSKTIDMSEHSLYYYEKIVALCKEKNIEVMAISFPCAGTMMDSRIELYNTIQKFCDENDIVYLNYNSQELKTEMGIDYDTDFYDNGHLNITGSIKLSASVAKRLVDNYGLTDHRGDPAYSDWDADWETFHQDFEITLQRVGY